MVGLSLNLQQILASGITLAFMMLVLVLCMSRRVASNPYERLPSILSPAEQHFYKVLFSVIQGRAIIMAKVRIADLLKVRKTIHQKHFWFHFSKISQKHVDFVLVHPRTFTVLCVIELDDKSHFRFDRIKRDGFVNRIMMQSNIPLYRFPVSCRYDRREILEKLHPYLRQ